MSTISNGVMSKFSNELITPLPVVEIQCSTEPGMAMDCAGSCLDGRGNDQSVFETLMVALCVIVVHVLSHGTP